MAQATFDQVLEQAMTLSASEQFRTHVPATSEPSPAAPEKLTITERLARANYKGGALFRTAEEVDAYIRAERDSWER